MNGDSAAILLRKAGSLLARRAYSRGEMSDALRKMGGEIPVESVLDRLEQLNLLNDADYAYNFALCRIRQDGWAPARVRNALLRRQVNAAVIDDTLDRIRSESGPTSELARLVQKHCAKKGIPSSPKELRTLVHNLLRHGYEDEEIRQTLRQMIPQATWQPFETGE